jgi:hypothetical protein
MRVILFTVTFTTMIVHLSAQTTPSALQQANDEVVKGLRAAIAGRENEPAGQVFKNVQYLKNTPAGTFLGIMNGGYAKALGVGCTYCHDDTDFSSDQKRPKLAAREMQTIHRSINDQLRAMKNVTEDPNNRAISCITCHRGEAKPFRG